MGHTTPMTTTNDEQRAKLLEFLQSDITHARFINAWVTEELQHKLEDVRWLSIRNEVERDKEAEEKANDRWKYWKQGKHVIFTVYFADTTHFVKAVERQELE